MTTDAFEPNTGAPAPALRTRPFFWSVRRELWENRSIFMGPLIAAGVVLVGFALSLAHPIQVRSAHGKPPHHIPAELPYDMGAAFIVFFGLMVGYFYCLGALHGERRDRSILFWKSLPVSDRTAVLAKAFVPMVVIPAVTVVVVIVAEAVMLLMSTLFLLAAGKDPAAHWAELSLVRNIPVFIYALVALALWQAPVFGWFLAVSAWAKRTPLLWAVGPWIALFAIEAIAFQTSHIASLIGDRFIGGMHAALRVVGEGKHVKILSEADPGKFLTTPDLWIGLVLAGALIALTVWLRRRREPI